VRAAVGATGRILNLTNAVVLLSGGNLPLSYTNDIILGLNSKVTNFSPNTLTLSFTPASGLFKGTFKPAGSTRSVSLNGAVAQKATNAAGFFLGTNQSGSVLIAPTPAP